MANISLKNFKKHFADEVKLWAAQCTVRECDEEEKGFFVAFVDQGVHSFDVNLKINPKQEIVNSTCDCPKGDGMCQHKLALMMHLVGNEKVVTTKIIKNKLSPLEVLLGELSHEELITWVIKTLDKDKPLKAEFIFEFSKKESVLLTKEDIEKKLKELLKAVSGSKRNINTPEFKKAMSLWESFVLGQLKIYFQNPTLYLYFEQLVFILQALSNQIEPIRTQTFTAYNNIKKKIVKEVSNFVSDIADEETFDKVINLMTANLLVDTSWNITLFDIILKTFDISTEVKQNKILELSLPAYKKFHQNTKFGDSTITKGIWNMIMGLQMFESSIDYILPITYDNEFNTKLIEQLIELKKNEKAIEFCQNIVRNNYYPEYNFPYWVFLKKLYAITKQPEKALEIKKQLIPFTGNFDDFMEVLEAMTDENEKRNYRINLLTKFRTHSQKGKFTSTDLFCIKLAGYEKNYPKLIDYLNDYSYIQFFMPHLENMLIQNKKKTLLNIINNFTGNSLNIKPEFLAAEQESYLPVYELLCKHFPEDELTAFLKYHLPFNLRKLVQGTLMHFISKNLI